MPKKVQTLEITNFGGRLTRILNGELNSGFAKFVPSFGYDPFSKPMNLTWLENPVDISTGITDLIVNTKPRFDRTNNVQYIFGVGHQGRIYKIQPNSISNPNVDSVVAISSVAGSFTFGAGMEFFGNTEKLYLGSDAALITTGTANGTDFIFNGVSSVIATVPNYVGNIFHPFREFIGKLIFGNGPSIGAIDSTGIVTSSVMSVSSVVGNQFSELNPALPPANRVQDLDVSPDSSYLLITASNLPNELLTTIGSDRQSASSTTDSALYGWNGSDQAVTTATTIPSYSTTALQTYLQHNVFFSNDAFGTAVNDGANKILTLPNNKAPFANSTLVNGNFLSWVCPESNSAGTASYASMYYFGSLDQENPPGLYRLFRKSTSLTGGFIYQTPVNILTNSKYMAINNAVTAMVPLGYGKHYFSVMDINPSTSEYKFYRFLVTPSGTGTAQSGVYETQNQLFSKRVGISQIRVYTEPTATNNAFQLDLVGGDGNIVTNGTFTYSFVAGSNPQSLKGSLERINFNPSIGTLFSVGLRITNTGSANMTIKKIEVDYTEEGQ